MTEEQQKYENELKAFAKDHIEFSTGLKWHFKQIGRMTKEARRALIDNLCNAHRMIFLEGPDLYVRVSKVERFKQFIAERKEAKE